MLKLATFDSVNPRDETIFFVRPYRRCVMRTLMQIACRHLGTVVESVRSAPQGGLRSVDAAGSGNVVSLCLLPTIVVFPKNVKDNGY